MRSHNSPPIFLKPCYGFLGDGGRLRTKMSGQFSGLLTLKPGETWLKWGSIQTSSLMIPPLLICADRAGDWTSTKPSIDSKCTGGELFIVSDRTFEGSISGSSVSCLILAFYNQNYCWMKVCWKKWVWKKTWSWLRESNILRSRSFFLSFFFSWFFNACFVPFVQFADLQFIP